MFQLRTVALLALCAQPLFGGVVLDGSFGTHGALPGPNYMITAPMGRQVNTNLFQSFSQFNLISSESATFTGPNNIQNILARVTSGGPSSIDGTIRSDIHGANLFFMNTAGVLFGQHAHLDVSGSFAVTTANYLTLAGGGRFNANLGGQDTLTSAPVTAFGFLSTTPAAVPVSGSALNVAPQKSFSVVAGDITMNGGTITGAGSRVNLVSVKSPGEVALDANNINSTVDVTQFAAMGDIDLANLAKIDTSGPDGGPVVIRGGNLYLNNSQVSSETTGTSDGLPVDVGLSGELDIVYGASIFTNALGRANGGNLSIHAGSLSIDGSATPDQFTGIGADSQGRGNAGNATITVDHMLSVTGHGEISTAAFSNGKGGNLSIHAGSLSIDGSATPGNATGIFVGTGSDPRATGDSGDLTITVDRALSVADTGVISASTFSRGHGGNLTIHAGLLSIDGSATPSRTTGIVANSEIGATGNAGDLTILVDQALRVLGSGQITADTYSSGKGGNLNIHAGSMLIDSSSIDSNTNISANAVRGTGNAGDLTVTVDGLLAIKGGGGIEADTSTSGKGGEVRINAGSILIDGSARTDLFTGIFAEADAGTANAGDLTLIVDHALRITGSGEISADTYSSGNAGKLTIHAGSLLIDGSATPDLFTGITTSSNAGATGNAGDLTLIVDQALNVVGSGEISADTSSRGKGGNLTILARSLSIDGSATPDQITGIIADSEEGATGNGGDLTIHVDQALRVLGSGQITADTYSSGKGGNLSIHAGSMFIDSTSVDSNTYISADAVNGTGNAGGLTVTVDGLLAIKGGGLIEADTSTSGKGGEVRINAGSILIDGSARPDLFTGIFAKADAGTGNAGNLTITVDQALSVAGRGQISADTFSRGNGGNLSIHAGSLSIDGSATPDNFTGITADSSPGATGNAGDLTITVDLALSIVGRGEIAVSTFSSGKGGNLSIYAGSLSIDGSATPHAFTGIGADTQGRGNAGNLTITVDRALSIVGRGEIEVSTFSSGNGGDVTVNARSIFIDNAGQRPGFTGIFAEATKGSAGRGGKVAINSDNLLLQNGGSVSALSVTLASAGSVQLNLGTLTMDSGGVISSANTASGAAGDVFIQTSGAVKLKHGSSISTASKMGDAGSIELFSGGVIRLRGGSSITVSAGANAGDIHITAPDLVYLTDSSITATAGRNGRSGKGGNITIDPQFIVLDNSLISANAAAGQGGNINLVSDFFFNSNSLITATGTTNGTVNISAPELDLGAELITLPTSLLSAENQLQERCTALLQGDFSSFISIGRGGTEPEPDELQEEF